MLGNGFNNTNVRIEYVVLEIEDVKLLSDEEQAIMTQLLDKIKHKSMRKGERSATVEANIVLRWSSDTVKMLDGAGLWKTE